MINTETAKIDLWTAPVTLEGRQLKLEPLGLNHLGDLAKNLLTAQTWHVVHWDTKTPADIEKGIGRSLHARADKTGNCFAMILKSGNQAVGRSSLMNFKRIHNYLEIGATWIAQGWQKSFVNTEAKLLMLTYAFETIGCQRVELRADSLNFNSQKAILRIGAKFEVELRNSCILPDGRKRDYKLYSIIDSEWPNIKKTLNWYLDKHV